jgi:hypothetical protein
MCKNGLLLIGLVLLAASVALLSPSEPRPAPLSDFDAESCVSRWVEMWNRYDLSLIDDLFVTDSRISYFSSEKQGAIRGIDAVREHHRGFGFVDGGKDQGSRLWVEDIRSDVFGGAAVVTGIWFFERAGAGQDEPQRGPVTIVYVPLENEFRIAHMHFATYLDKEQTHGSD